MKITRECPNCGKVLEVFPCRAKNTAVTFCNTNCRAQYSKGENNPNWKGGLIQRQCLYCEKAFSVKPKEIRAGGGKFCSVPCARTYTSETALGYDPDKRIKKLCQVCGKELWIKKSHEHKEGSYCSYRCMAVGYKTRQRGKNNPNYRHGRAGTDEWKLEMNRRWRANNPQRRRELHRRWLNANPEHSRQIRRALEHKRRAKKKGGGGSYTQAEWNALCEYYDNRCLCCGRKDVALTADHVIPIELGGSSNIDNIQPLCRSCNSSKGIKTTDYRNKGSVARWTQEKLL